MFKPGDLVRLKAEFGSLIMFKDPAHLISLKNVNHFESEVGEIYSKRTSSGHLIVWYPAHGGYLIMHNSDYEYFNAS